MRRMPSITVASVLLAAALFAAAPATPSAAAVSAPAFSSDAAWSHVSALASFGPRIAGRWPEQRGADYIAAQLRSYGYSVSVRTFSVPGGLTSRNVVATDPGTSGKTLILGAHMDSKYPSPGGNDNASGCGVLLEMARVMKQAQQLPTLKFVFFGAEEMSGSDPEQHHFGSRAYLASMSAADRSATAGMVSVDMVGYGTDFTVRSMDVGPQDLVAALELWRGADGVSARFMKDTARGQSDHEPFERAGIASAWLEWRDDKAYHTTADTSAHVSRNCLDKTGRFLRTYILGMTWSSLASLTAVAPVVSGANSHPAPVTPNGDGWADFTYANYTVNEPCKVTVKVYDPSWRLLRVSSRDVRRYAGFHSERLDLRGPDGQPLRDGFYRFTVTAYNSKGAHARGGSFFISRDVRTAPALYTQPKLSSVWVGKPAPRTAEFHWTQSARGWVTIKVYSGSGLVRTVMYNAGQDAGARARRWDGKDNAGRDLPAGTYAYYVLASGGGLRPATSMASGNVVLGR